VSVFVLGIGGTTRPGSSTEKALRVSLEAAAREGAETLLLGAEDLSLPMYSPESSERTPTALRLIEEVKRADGILVASPGYHGTVSGLVKNALDYIEDLRSHSPPYLDGRAVGCIACAYGWQATVTTLMALRSIAHALRGWPTPMGAAINSAGPVFDADGSCIDEGARFQLELVGVQVVEFAQMHAARQTVGESLRETR
jgi:FMN reductase